MCRPFAVNANTIPNMVDYQERANWSKARSTTVAVVTSMNTKLASAVLLLLLSAIPAQAQTPVLGKDWKKAVWRVPLHIALSIPVAAGTLVVPPVGKAYVKWRIRAEQQDIASGSDTSGKAAIDLYSQTAIVRGVLKMYHIKVPQ